MTENGEFKHLVRTKFLTRPLIDQIFTEADLMERVLNFREDAEIRDYRKRLRQEFQEKGIIVMTLFVEESLRTRFSFECAAIRLGASTLSTENAARFSSMAKGESLEHTIMVASGKAFTNHRYADLIVLRHTEEGAAKRAMKVSGVPIINAGDGPGEHPTQALLDLYTIRKELGRTEDFSIAMVGDLLNGRTIHSLAYLLAKFKGVKMYFVSDPRFRIKEGLRQYLIENEVWFTEKTRPEDFKDVVTKVHAVYMTRVQKNRFNLEDPEQLRIFRSIRELYVMDRELADAMLLDAILMHPMPIDSADSEFKPEILPEVDFHPKTRFLTQAGYGDPTRMAETKILLENWGSIDRIEP